MQIHYAASGAPSAGALVVLAAKGAPLAGAVAALDVATGGQLARAVAVARFEGDVASIVELLAPAHAASRILIVGVGAANEADAGAFEKIGGAIVARLLTSGEASVTIDLTGLDGMAVSLAVAAARLAHGATLRAYRFDKYRTTMKPAQASTLTSLTIVGAEVVDDAHLTALAAGVALTRDLVSEPANIIYPESFVERVQAAAPEGLIVEVFGEQEMSRLGMGALLGVSQGSEREAKVLTMRWMGGDDGATPVVLVGKQFFYNNSHKWNCSTTKYWRKIYKLWCWAECAQL